jgi:hypothetical protein
MSKKWIIFVVLVTIFTSFQDGFAQKTRGGSKGQQAIVETGLGGYSRGWVKREGKGKVFFTDDTGKTTELAKGAKVHPVAEIRREYKQVEQSIMNQDIKDFEKYTKLLAWAKEHRLYEEAIRNAEHIIRLNPANPDPEAQDAIKEAREKLNAARGGPTGDMRTDWTLDDVQKVRFALLPTRGRIENMMVTFKKQVLQAFVNDMNKEGKLQTREAQRQFLQSNPTAQAQTIKIETGNKYQPDVVIGKDPEQILEFRRTIEPLLNRSCAATACHGAGALPFKLLARPTKPQEVYANFYSLDTYQTEKGALIDHGSPDKSLFLSFLLPPGAGSSPSHPIKIVAPMKTEKDPRYRQVLLWIRSLPPQPIDEAINQEGISTQPASISKTENQ